MSLGLELPCELELGTWPSKPFEVDKVKVRDGCRLRQKYDFSGFERPGSNLPAGIVDLVTLREASRFVTDFLRQGMTVITAKIAPEPRTPAKSVKVLSPAISRTPAKKGNPVETSRHWRHVAFLMKASHGDSPAISTHIAQQSMRAWSEIRRATQNQMPVPAAMTGPDGQMFYSWDSGRHHMELELAPDESPFFFYRDRQTGETWSEDYEAGAPSNAALSRLRFFFQA